MVIGVCCQGYFRSEGINKEHQINIKQICLTLTSPVKDFMGWIENVSSFKVKKPLQIQNVSVLI
jgi:hypothetical protein